MRLIFTQARYSSILPASTFNTDQVNHQLRRDILVAAGEHGGLTR